MELAGGKYIYTLNVNDVDKSPKGLLYMGRHGDSWD